MLLDIHQLIPIITGYLLVFSRVASVLMVMPMIGSSYFPRRIRLFIAITFSMAIAQSMKLSVEVDLFSIQHLLLIVEQVLVGVCIGMMLVIVFQVFILAGQLITLQSGLSFAAMVDPTSGLSTPIMSQFYVIFIALLFFATNMHLTFIEMLQKSFEYLPADQGMQIKNISHLIDFSSIIFKGALLMTLPGVIILLMVNLVFAIITRSAPQFNVFNLGFMLTVLFGLLVFYGSFSIIDDDFKNYFTQGINLVRTILLPHVAE